MAKIFLNILPLFILMGLGVLARRLGYLTKETIPVLNRLTYYMAIPVMIFLEVSRSDFAKDFHLPTVTVASISIPIAAFFAYLMARMAGLKGAIRGSLIQCSIHGNLGYLGLAVSFYVMGSDGLIKASIFAGFLIIVQNVISVVSLSYFSGKREGERRFGRLFKEVGLNPIIIAALSGIVFSLLKIPMPAFLKESMQLLGKMALPLALLVIGASLTLNLFGEHLTQGLLVVCIKLMVLPFLGYVLLKWVSASSHDLLASIILLSSPTATVTYVMAWEMGGDPKFTAASISSCTALSIISYSFWVWSVI